MRLRSEEILLIRNFINYSTRRVKEFAREFTSLKSKTEKSIIAECTANEEMENDFSFGSLIIVIRYDFSFRSFMFFLRTNLD